jgi:hypothetical protein
MSFLLTAFLSTLLDAPAHLTHLLITHPNKAPVTIWGMV